MAFKLASAYVELSQRGLGGIMGGLGRLKKGLGSTVSMALPVAAGIAAIGGVTVAAGAKMVGMAASLEQTETQFKTLLGSSDAAKHKIEELQQFAAGTPFQFDGLAQSAKTLLAFGVSNEQVIPTMQKLGDVAAATGNDVNELANIYGKVKARGALMTESLDQFNERGIPVGDKLAEMFGKTGEEIRKMASEGKISFGDLQTAMKGMTDEGGMAFEGMKSQSGTLSGLWSTLQDNVTLVMTDIGGAIVEGFDLKSVTSDFTGFVQTFRAEWIPSIVEGFRWASDNIVKPMVSGIQTIGMAAYDFVSDWDLYWKYARLSTANQLHNMYQHVSTFFENAVTIGGWFYDNAIAIFANIYEKAGGIFENLTQQIKNNWESLIEFFESGEFKFDFSPLAESFKATFEGIEIPELKSPQGIDTYASDLDRIGQQLATRWEARDKARRERAKGAHGDTMDEFAIEDAARKKAADEEKRDSFAFVSLSELANRMQEKLNETRKDMADGGGDMPGMVGLGEKAGAAAAGMEDRKAELALLQRQVFATEQLAQQVGSGGLKVARTPDQQVQLPNASVAFGGVG